MVKELNLDEIIFLTLEYNAESGKLSWKHRDSAHAEKLGMDEISIKHFNKKYAGKEILNKASTGYIQVCFKFRNSLINEDITLLAHRVSWFLFYKYWPKIIDHIDGDKLNNKIDNLREVTHSENIYNSKKRTDNTSGKVGVSFKVDKNKWKAYYNQDGKQIHLGYFETLDEAVKARNAWEESSGLTFRS